MTACRSPAAGPLAPGEDGAPGTEGHHDKPQQEPSGVCDRAVGYHHLGHVPACRRGHGPGYRHLGCLAACQRDQDEGDAANGDADGDACQQRAAATGLRWRCLPKLTVHLGGGADVLRGQR